MHSFRSRRGGGFTLLEVVIGLTLMATVLVSSLLSFTAHRKQRRFADSKLAAVAYADDLLNLMSASPDGIPHVSRGPVQGKPDWFWQTNVAGMIAPAQTPLRVIRFEIIETTAQGSLRPLVSIDLVEPLEG